jgi:plastocyanin
MKYSYTLLLALLTGTAGAQTIVQSNFSFNPNTLTVSPGATITVTLGSPHTFTQVSEATWNANGNTILPGGFNFSAGTHQLTLDVPGTYYYVCLPHASMGMKGKIIVDTGTGTVDRGLPTTLVFPNPASSELTVAGPAQERITAILYDAAGHEALRGSLMANDRLSVAHLQAGTYTLQVLDGNGRTIDRRQVALVR